MGPRSVGELPVGLARGRLVRLGQIEKVGLRVEQEARLVLMVDPIGGIVLREGRYRGPDVLDADGVVGPLERVHEAPLVAMRVPIELGHNGFPEAIHDVDEIE